MCCTRSDVEARRFGALEMRCRSVDVEIPEIWCSGALAYLFVVVGISSFRSSMLFGQNACGLRHLSTWGGKLEAGGRNNSGWCANDSGYPPKVGPL